jgi:hypothetical protein
MQLTFFILFFQKSYKGIFAIENVTLADSLGRHFLDRVTFFLVFTLAYVLVETRFTRLFTYFLRNIYCVIPIISFTSPSRPFNMYTPRNYVAKMNVYTHNRIMP